MLAVVVVVAYRQTGKQKGFQRKIILSQKVFTIIILFAHTYTVPRLDLIDPESGYHGLIREDELVVEARPTIRAVGAEICGFRIVSRHHGDTPFEVRTRQ